MSSAPAHDLHIVSGKGGTGKTTIAAALACALANSGRRVLLCEVEGRHSLTDLFAVPELGRREERRLCRTPAGGQVFGMSINAEDALMEYLETFYRLGMAGRALDRFGVFDFATSIAPGLGDVLLTGKVYEAVRRRAKGRSDAYDAVVLDAPPTGRIAKFLNVNEAVAGLAKMGPIRTQADSITEVLRSDGTVVHLVTLPEDMPVTETLDAITELEPTKITVGSLICNRATASPLTDTEVASAVDGKAELAVAGLTDEQLTDLATELAEDATRLRDQRACRQRLDEVDLPVADVPLDPDGIDVDAVFAIADTLADQLELFTRDTARPRRGGRR